MGVSYKESEVVITSSFSRLISVHSVLQNVAVNGDSMKLSSKQTV